MSNHSETKRNGISGSVQKLHSFLLVVRTKYKSGYSYDAARLRTFFTIRHIKSVGEMVME